MDISFFEELGFTQGEAKVYLALLALGQSTSGPIIKKSGISSSKVYEILGKLMEKGLVSYVTINDVKHFEVTHPEKLDSYLEHKQSQLKKQQEELQDIMPRLLALHSQQLPAQDSQLFVGVRAVKTMLRDLLADARPGEHYRFFAGQGQEYEEAVREFYKTLSFKRRQKDLVVRGVAHESQKRFLASDSYELRTVSFPTPSNITIFQDHVCIISWAGEPIGVKITSKDVAEQFSTHFDEVWKLASK